MSVDDQQRYQLHQRLESVLGTEEAATLMSHLPPVTWHNVATRDDLRVTTAELRGEMAELRTEMRVGFADVRTDLGQQIHDAMITQLRWSLGFFAAWSTAMLATVRILFG